MTGLLCFIAKYWRSLLFSAVVAAALGGAVLLRDARLENARLLEENRAAAAVVARLTEELAENRRALETREAESKVLAGERRAALAELDRLYAEDQESCDWASGKVPKKVYDKLCGAD